jgi:hypothetical protein
VEKVMAVNDQRVALGGGPMEVEKARSRLPIRLLLAVVVAVVENRTLHRLMRHTIVSSAAGGQEEIDREVSLFSYAHLDVCVSSWCIFLSEDDRRHVQIWCHFLLTFVVVSSIFLKMVCVMYRSDV